MAQIDDTLRKLQRALTSDDPVTISAADARLLYNLITADPQVLAANVADAAIDACFAARDVYYSGLVEEEAYWQAHRRLVRACGAVVNIGWLIVAPEESINSEG